MINKAVNLFSKYNDLKCTMGETIVFSVVLGSFKRVFPRTKEF